MEKEALLKAMKASISDVLETMFFIPVEFEASEKVREYIRQQKDPLLGGRLEFKGPFSGWLTFILPEGLARTLTANFLGEDETQVDRDHVEGTLMEILNMITGRAFGLYDDQAIFELGVPRMIAVETLSRAGQGMDHEEVGLLIRAPGATLALSAQVSM